MMTKQQYIYAGIGLMAIIVAFIAIKWAIKYSNKDQLTQEAKDLLERIDEAA